MWFILHPRIQRDLRAALSYYEEEGGPGLADRFFDEAEAVVDALKRNPQGFHFIAEGLRRASFQSFPYHFVYEEDPIRVRVLVLRHDKRHPAYGLRRR
ncbi:type II toxin-antitoxin system RelE/ParE family toxin [Luteolibacter arcticus]|uniref:Type II toxin-antitoxin system RelE/ParE family toxin n=1 Tax=Luteolibacter arcticus TaxID=1581411 RepID=A0ABT3GRX8_9BACT|nr:type II toxin-antitoxin system RelE/ParE family toxin [Luteolibacter arcticus]MCW1926242.1 type II toxin-antitoxin system RelE/ParE family toxin [Luteolibacter arcticus]